MKIRYAGSTHVGMKRSANEDNFFLLAEQNLYIVCDGMGGHSSGEVASQVAVESLANFFIDTSRDDEITWPYKEDKSTTYDENRLVTGCKLANRRVFETSRSDPKYRGMGTTLVALLCGQTGAYAAHIGDSRCYLIRDGEIIQITEDHSLLNDYLKVHSLTPEEIEAFPHKNVIVRACGMKEVVNVEINKLDPRSGDIFLLCSDGLCGMINDADMLADIDTNRGDLERMCQSLIAKANANGGTDNITAVLVEFYD